MDKREMLHIYAEVGPVRGKDVLCPLRKLQRVKYFLCGVCARAEHIGIFLFENIGVRMTGGRRNVGDAVQHLLKEIEQLCHLRAAARHILLHLVDERLDAGRHRNVHGSAVGILADDAEAIVYSAPFHLDAVLIHNRPHVAGIFHGTEVADLMQRRFDLKPAAPERGRAAAGEIVLLDQQRFSARQHRLKRRG